MGVKTTVDIADPLFEEAKRESERTGVTLRELIELGLQRELERRRQVKPFRLRDASVTGTGVAPGMREDKIRWYLRVGEPGYPDTIEGMTKWLDDEYPRRRRR
jgi:hypothetical protein